MRAIEMIEDQHLCQNVVEREVDGIDPITLQEGRHIRYYTRRETAAQQIIRKVPIHQVDLLTLNIGHIMRTEFAKKGERIDREITARYGMNLDDNVKQKVDKLLGNYRTREKKVDQSMGEYNYSRINELLGSARGS